MMDTSTSSATSAKLASAREALQRAFDAEKEEARQLQRTEQTIAALNTHCELVQTESEETSRLCTEIKSIIQRDEPEFDNCSRKSSLCNELCLQIDSTTTTKMQQLFEFMQQLQTNYISPQQEANLKLEQKMREDLNATCDSLAAVSDFFAHLPVASPTAWSRMLADRIAELQQWHDKFELLPSGITLETFDEILDSARDAFGWKDAVLQPFRDIIAQVHIVADRVSQSIAQNKYRSFLIPECSQLSTAEECRAFGTLLLEAQSVLRSDYEACMASQPQDVYPLITELHTYRQDLEELATMFDKLAIETRKADDQRDSLAAKHSELLRRQGELDCAHCELAARKIKLSEETQKAQEDLALAEENLLLLKSSAEQVTVARQDCDSRAESTVQEIFALEDEVQQLVRSARYNHSVTYAQREESRLRSQYSTSMQRLEQVKTVSTALQTRLTAAQGTTTQSESLLGSYAELEELLGPQVLHLRAFPPIVDAAILSSVVQHVDQVADEWVCTRVEAVHMQKLSEIEQQIGSSDLSADFEQKIIDEITAFGKKATSTWEQDLLDQYREHSPVRLPPKKIPARGRGRSDCRSRH